MMTKMTMTKMMMPSELRSGARLPTDDGDDVTQDHDNDDEDAK